MSALLFAILVAAQIGAFPPLKAQPLAMIDIQESHLSAGERRAVMALVKKGAKTNRCPNPVLVAEPPLAAAQRVIIVNGCESSAPGNAFFWITLEQPSGLQVLASSGHVQQVYVLGTASYGLKDMVAGSSAPPKITAVKCSELGRIPGT